MARYQRNGFTLVEMMVTLSVVILLVSILLPTLGAARDAAAYTRWKAYSKNLKLDNDLILYYDFENQTGEEVNKQGIKIAHNKTEGSNELKHKYNVTKSDYDGEFGALESNLALKPLRSPHWDFKGARWRGKGGISFIKAEHATFGTSNFNGKESGDATGKIEEFTVAWWTRHYSDQRWNQFIWLHDGGDGVTGGCWGRWLLEVAGDGHSLWTTTGDASTRFTATNAVYAGRWVLLSYTRWIPEGFVPPSANINAKGRIWVDGQVRSEADQNKIDGAFRGFYMGEQFNNYQPDAIFDEIMFFKRDLGANGGAELKNMYEMGFARDKE